MSALTQLSQNVQRALCMLLATAIVGGALIMGNFEAQSAAHQGYSVTITQIQ